MADFAPKQMNAEEIKQVIAGVLQQLGIEKAGTEGQRKYHEKPDAPRNRKGRWRACKPNGRRTHEIEDFAAQNPRTPGIFIAAWASQERNTGRFGPLCENDFRA